MIKEERFSREGKMMVDRRFLVRLCGILLGVGILMSMASLCSSHGHAHDHHGHAHDHHGHAHDHHGHSHEEKPSFKYSRQANIKEDDHHDHHDHGHHGHTHDHHGHAHDHHGHSHEQKSSSKYSKEANVKEAPKPAKAADCTTTLWLNAMTATLLISVAPFFVLFLIPIDNTPEYQPFLKVLLSFASGGLLGDAFLHLIPHALMASGDGDGGHAHSHGHSHGDGEHHGHDMTVGFWVLGGIMAFLMVEKFIRLVKGSHGHSHSHSAPAAEAKKDDSAVAEKKTDRATAEKKTDEAAAEKKTDKAVVEKEKKDAVDEQDSAGDIKVAGYLNLAADFTHNLTDGLAIGASFLAGSSIGYVTTITVLLHEVPHEIGDFAILIQSGCSRKKAMLLQLITALGALTGCALSLLVGGVGSAAVAWILPFTAGGFIYIACVSVLPELLESQKWSQSLKEMAALFLGVYMMVLIAQFE